MDQDHSLSQLLGETFTGARVACCTRTNEVTLTLPSSDVRQVMLSLRDDERFAFDTLIDLCGVDYQAYGLTEWETVSASSCGFGRAVDPKSTGQKRPPGERFAVVYHLLSTQLNHRLRVRSYATGSPVCMPSVVDVWACANWYEREAFDLFGIVFDGHPDLRRILTDYGFIGHPLRKDFPLSGEVEVRYCPKESRVIYQPVSIEPRVLVPRVIRQDSRYESSEKGQV